MLDAFLNLSQLLANDKVNTDLVTYLIKIGNLPIASNFEVKSLLVYKAANKIAFARLTILDGYVDRMNFPASNQNIFSPGKLIEIQAGYHNDNKTIFKGIITRHAVRARRGQSDIMELECRDISVKMTITRRNKYFDNLTDTDIIRDIVGGYNGIVADKIERTEITHPHMVQYHATDWDFTIARAEANGMLVFANDGEVSVQEPNFEQEPVLVLTFGTNIEEFEGEMDARDQYPAVKTSAWRLCSKIIIASLNRL